MTVEELVRRKQSIKKQMMWGELSLSAKAAGVDITSIRDWFEWKRFSSADTKYLTAIETVIKNRVAAVEDGFSRVEAALEEA